MLGGQVPIAIQVNINLLPSSTAADTDTRSAVNWRVYACTEHTVHGFVGWSTSTRWGQQAYLEC